jgi:hypothetical protein
MAMRVHPRQHTKRFNCPFFLFSQMGMMTTMLMTMMAGSAMSKFEFY